MNKFDNSSNTMIKLTATNYSICCLYYENTLLCDKGKPEKLDASLTVGKMHHRLIIVSISMLPMKQKFGKFWGSYIYENKSAQQNKAFIFRKLMHLDLLRRGDLSFDHLDVFQEILN